jgi:hypothetical protein
MKFKIYKDGEPFHFEDETISLLEKKDVYSMDIPEPEMDMLLLAMDMLESGVDLWCKWIEVSPFKVEIA